MSNPAAQDPEMDQVERIISYYNPPGTEGQAPVPMIYAPKCFVCRHPQRVFIENACFMGYSHKHIISRLEDPTSLNWWNIKAHFTNGHVPMHQQQAVLDTIWKRAIEDGVTPDDYDTARSAHLAAVDLMVDKFYSQLKDPRFVLDAKEGIAAIRLMLQMESQSQGEFDPNDMYVALSLFMTHVRTILTRYVPGSLNEALADLQTLLSTDPVLKKISERMTKVNDDLAVGMLDSEETEETDEAEDAVVVDPVDTPSIPPPAYISLDTPNDFDEPDD